MKIVILNKPYDVLSQFREDEKHLTMSAFVDDPDLRLAGRLDMDSEGLVFLTDHGGLNQFITNPANKKYKTYLVQVDGDVTEDALAQLRKGVELKDGMTLPAQAYKVDEPEWLWSVILLYVSVLLYLLRGLKFQFVKVATAKCVV